MKNVQLFAISEWKRQGGETPSKLNQNRTITEVCLGTYTNENGSEARIIEPMYTDLIPSLKSGSLRAVIDVEYNPHALIYMGSILIEHNDDMPGLFAKIAEGLKNTDPSLLASGLQEITEGIAQGKAFGVKANFLKYSILNAAGIKDDCPMQLIYGVNEAEEEKKMYESKHPEIEEALESLNLTEFLPEFLRCVRGLDDTATFFAKYPKLNNTSLDSLKEEVLLTLIKQKLGK